MTRLHSKEEALAYIKKSLNFRGAEESSNPSTPEEAYFSGEPVIDDEKSIYGAKAWKYHWPDQKGARCWVSDDGEKHDEADIDAELEILADSRKI